MEYNRLFLVIVSLAVLWVLFIRYLFNCPSVAAHTLAALAMVEIVFLHSLFLREPVFHQQFREYYSGYWRFSRFYGDLYNRVFCDIFRVRLRPEILRPHFLHKLGV